MAETRFVVTGPYGRVMHVIGQAEHLLATRLALGPDDDLILQERDGGRWVDVREFQ